MGLWPDPLIFELGNLTTVGETSTARDGGVATVGTTSQVMRLTFFTARKTETTTQVRIGSGATAAGATPTLVRFGLYLVDSAGDGTLVASTANDTSLFAAANTLYTRSWSASYAKVAGLRYALAVLVVTTATSPTVYGFNSNGAGSDEGLVDPKLSARNAGTVTDLPTTFVGSALTASGSRIYGVILP